MVSLTQWTWVRTNSGRWWRIGKLGILQSVGSQSQTRLNDWTTVWSYYHFLNCFGFILCRSFPSLVFCASRSSFSICYKAVFGGAEFSYLLLVWKALDFSIKSEWESCWVGYSWFFLFINLNISCHSFLASRVSVEKSTDNLMGVHCYVICPFVLVVFYILSLSLIFIILITMCLGAFLLGFILPWTFCASWTWLTIFPC